MRSAMAGLISLLVIGAGCGTRTNGRPGAPLISGELQSGTFWKSPLGSVSNEGGDYPKGSRVAVYDNVVVVTTPDGLSHVHPSGYYSNLSIKKD